MLEIVLAQRCCVGCVEDSEVAVCDDCAVYA